MDTSGGETHLKLTLVKYIINKQAGREGNRTYLFVEQEIRTQ